MEFLHKLLMALIDRQNQISTILANSRCIEGERSRILPSKFRNNSMKAQIRVMRYFTINALQISQNGGCVISSSPHKEIIFFPYFLFKTCFIVSVNAIMIGICH